MSSNLDEADVRHVAHLARLEISDAQVATLAEQLSSILGYVDKLNELDTTDIPPTAHALLMSNVFRGDVARSAWTADQALHNAPDRHGDYFCVPKVLGQEGAQS